MASILLVCTGNVCRSPIAEGFLRDALRRRFGDRAPEVTSAGTAGWEGSSAMPEAVHAARERGTDVSGHRARRLLAGHVEDADLVIAMAGDHRDRIVAAAPDAAGRTFTLKELVRLLERLPAADHAPDPIDGDLERRIEAADALRRERGGAPVADEDVADPLGLPINGYRAIAWELEGWTGRLVDGLFGPVDARPAAAGGEG